MIDKLSKDTVRILFCRFRSAAEETRDQALLVVKAHVCKRKSLHWKATNHKSMHQNNTISKISSSGLITHTGM